MVPLVDNNLVKKISGMALCINMEAAELEELLSLLISSSMVGLTKCHKCSPGEMAPPDDEGGPDDSRSDEVVWSCSRKMSIIEQRDKLC